MSAWTWIKVGVIVVLFGGTVWWHAGKVDAVRDAAFSAGRLEVESEQLRETQRELARMVGITNNLNEAYREQAELIEGLRFSAVADADRMRQLTAQRRAALAAAPAETVRDYAATAADVYAACRSEYRALGLDARSCSATAHTLDQYADEVSGRPSRPTPPTPPAKP